MIDLIRTDSSNPDFKVLVSLLDKELAIRDGNEHEFYAQFNSIDHIKCVVIAYSNNKPISCGAIKYFEQGQMEIKRMFTVSNFRGMGVASKVLRELEKWAQELNCSYCVLETGVRQPEAIHLYEKNGYQRIQNYGQYKGVINSVCFQKSINDD